MTVQHKISSLIDSQKKIEGQHNIQRVIKVALQCPKKVQVLYIVRSIPTNFSHACVKQYRDEGHQSSLRSLEIHVKMDADGMGL